MREIALDTETTGISPGDGHRIIEIGALELMHHLPTGRKLHLYINPEREIDADAVAVHGITSDFLADKPVFADIVDEVAGVYPKVMNDGEPESGAWSCGMVAGLINDIPTCKELIDQIMSESEEIINNRLGGFLNN